MIFINSCSSHASDIESSIQVISENNTLGNLIVVGVSENSGQSVLSVSDETGNTYTNTGATSDNKAGPKCEVWYAVNTKDSKSNLITVTYDNPTSRRSILVLEFMGNSLTPFVGSKIISDLSAIISSNINVSKADSLVIAMITGDDKSLNPVGLTQNERMMNTSIQSGIGQIGIFDFSISLKSLTEWAGNLLIFN